MTAAKLIRPDAKFKESFMEALREYHQESRYAYLSFRQLDEDFEGFINEMRDDSSRHYKNFHEWTDPVPETVLWLVKDGVYIGSVDIRHRLNWHLEKLGGHLHFIIRPSMRGRGFGKKILQKAIPFAHHLGIDRALITVRPDNQAAERIIEFAGGALEDQTPETEKFPACKRYWVDCT